MIKIKKLLILCVLISTIIAHWVLWTSAGYSAYALRVPLDTDSQRLNEAMAAERMKTQLADLIAGITGMPDAEVTQELNLLTTPVLRQAWLKRFNLNSGFFKDQFVKLWAGGARDKRAALGLLAKGYVTVQRLGSRGECKISFSDIKRKEFAAELPPSLRNMVIYQSPKKNNATVSIEWAWVPGLDQWLPVQVDSTMLKTLFDSEGIFKIGAHISRKALKKFHEDNGENYKLCMRTGPEGHFNIGSEKLPSGRERGTYKQTEETGNIVIATISQNGVPVEFFFMGNDAPVYPKRIAIKDGNGEIELIESHLALDADTLHALTLEYGSFWVFFQTNDKRFRVGAKAISGNLAENRPPWVNRYLTINPADQTYALSITHYLQLPAEETAVEVLMTGGVPAYIKRGEQKVILKRLESESAPKNGSLLRDPIDSFVDDMTSEALLKALAHAMQKNLNIVATRLIFSPVGRDGGPGWNVGMAGQRIYIRAELVSQDFEYAEVVYNPADVVYDETTGQATPRPAEIRAGHYTTDDPDKLSKCRFETLAVFFLEEDEDSPGRFIAYQPAQLDLRTSPRTDL
jgi:hypothetical protein